MRKDSGGGRENDRSIYGTPDAGGAQGSGPDGPDPASSNGGGDGRESTAPGFDRMEQPSRPKSRTGLIEYDPLPSQRTFHESAARFKGFSGPIGSGKSQALCHEAIRLSYLNPGRQGLIGAPTYSLPLSRGMRRSIELE